MPLIPDKNKKGVFIDPDTGDFTDELGSPLSIEEYNKASSADFYSPEAIAARQAKSKSKLLPGLEEIQAAIPGIEAAKEFAKENALQTAAGIGTALATGGSSLPAQAGWQLLTQALATAGKRALREQDLASKEAAKDIALNAGLGILGPVVKGTGRVVAPLINPLEDVVVGGVKINPNVLRNLGVNTSAAAEKEIAKLTGEKGGIKLTKVPIIPGTESEQLKNVAERAIEGVVKKGVAHVKPEQLGRNLMNLEDSLRIALRKEPVKGLESRLLPAKFTAGALGQPEADVLQKAVKDKLTELADLGYAVSRELPKSAVLDITEKASQPYITPLATRLALSLTDNNRSKK